MRPFEDHFSRRAEVYVRHRPTYPAELYSYLASQAPHRRLAWDCGTGNGQAAIGLAEYFDRVIATDASAEQITLATQHKRVEYKLARAEDAGLETGSMALVTVAVAVHWFDFDLFYDEVRRTLSHEGLIAVWCYSLPTITPGINSILDNYLHNILGGYWPDRARHMIEEYRALPFPFEELKVPSFTMITHWDLFQVLGFLESWSGTARFEEKKGYSPIELIQPQLKEEWGAEATKRRLDWKLPLRVGRVHGEF